MTVEAVTYIDDLNSTYPAGTDAKSEGDDHIRNIKIGLKATFPNITGPVTATHSELSLLAGLTTEMGLLAGVTNSVDNFPSGTLMLFQQTTAPTGWTKETTHDDKALRVVSGTASSGGTTAFSTVFARTATDAHTLILSEIPAHTHENKIAAGAGAGNGLATYSSNTVVSSASDLVSSSGGNGSHSHDIDMQVQYVDIIIASKD